MQEINSIEIEKKFNLRDGDKERLIKNAEFLGEKIMEDVYYDTSDWSLTTTDRWLRRRGEKWELKLPLSARELIDQYSEIDSEDEIRKALAISAGKDIIEDLTAAGYAPVVALITRRLKYKRGDFTIDLDEVTAENFSYTIAELELMISDLSQKDEAMSKIEIFAEENGLAFRMVRGKVIEYLRQKSPDHYRALVAAKVVIED